MPSQPVIIVNLTKEIIHNARAGDYGKAASNLNRCLLHIQAELARGQMEPILLKKVTAILEVLLSAQKRNDWVAFADVLEFEFIDFWQTNCTASP